MPGMPKRRAKRESAQRYKQLLQNTGGQRTASQLTDEAERRLGHYEHYGLVGEIFKPTGGTIHGCCARMSDSRREELAQKGREDLHFLATIILQYTRLSAIDGPHGQMCSWVQDAKGGRRGALIHRAGFKTTVCNYARNIQRVVQRPNDCHIIVTADDNFKKIMSGTIAAKLEDPFFQFFYPDIRPKKNEWSTNIRCIQRPGRSDIQSPTFEFRTVKQSIAGRHVASITMDDPVTDTNTETPKVHQHVIDFIQRLPPTMDTDELMLLGTRYADWDAYGWMLDDPGWSEHLNWWIEPLYKDEAGERTYFFPDEWDDERTAVEKQLMGLSNFSAQYMLEPLPAELQIFHADMFKHYRDKSKPDMGIYIVVDPASGEGTSEPAIVAVGADGDGNLYVVDYMTGFKTATACINGVFTMAARHNPLQVCVEVIGSGGKVMYQNITQECAKRRIPLPLVALPVTQQNKHARLVQSLEPPYTAGMVYHIDWIEDSQLEEQLLRFPKGKKDDIIDALAYAVQRARRYGYGGAAVDEPDTDEFRFLREATGKTLMTAEQRAMMGILGIELKGGSPGSDEKITVM